MHFEDLTDGAGLEIVVYKHGTDKKNKYYYEIESIQSCKYINPQLIKRLLDKMDKLTKKPPFKFLKDLEEEEWYLFKLKINNGRKIEVLECVNVTCSLNEYHKLH